MSSSGNYFVLDVNDYIPPSGSVLASETLTFEDVYNDFPEWRVFTLLVPNIQKGHTIETRVKLLSDHTLTVDYVKIEPAGAFVSYPFYFKIDTEHIRDFSITSSKIGSFEIHSQHIGNFEIKNNHIDTLQITYDKLVKPPIGWNEVINPGFEYGMWEQWTGTDASFSRASIEAHSGEWSAMMMNWLSTPSGKIGNASEWILLNPSEDSVVVSSWINAKLESGYACSWIRFFDSNKNQISAVDFNTVDGPDDTGGWRLDCVTLAIPANAKYARVGIWANTITKGTVYFDDLSLVYGDQYTSFIDTTVAKNRWLPDTYYSKESSSINLQAPTTVTCLTLPVTIDYTAKALVFAGINVNIGKTISPDSKEWAVGYVNLYCDGSSIASKRISQCWYNGDTSSLWFSCWYEVGMIDEATLTPGPHTITLELESGLFSPDAFGYQERYIRVLLGQFYST